MVIFCILCQQSVFLDNPWADLGIWCSLVLLSLSYLIYNLNLSPNHLFLHLYLFLVVLFHLHFLLIHLLFVFSFLRLNFLHLTIVCSYTLRLWEFPWVKWYQLHLYQTYNWQSSILLKMLPIHLLCCTLIICNHRVVL